MKTVIIRHEMPEWTDEYVEDLSGEFPAFNFQPAYDEASAMALAKEAYAYIGIGPKMSPKLVSAMPKLEWIQSLTTGVDNLLAMKELPDSVAISRCTGVQGPQMSELALTLMLALARQLPDALQAQGRCEWDRRPQALLHGKVLSILGLGSIAETLALYGKTLGMTVTGVSGRAEAPNIDKIYPREQLLEAAAEADFFVVLIPLSPETRHIVGSEVLSAMKPSAYLVNIARGGCVDEEALLVALQEGSIAGAGIDVFETTPLPPDNPIWQAPNTIITPHVGGFADVYHKQCFPTVLENFRIYAEHGPEALTNALRKNQC